MMSSLIWIALLYACGDSTTATQDMASSQPSPEAVATLPHVVLITLDTTRADRIGAYGYDKATTPSIDALAASGRRYAWAFSPVPLTIPSHSAMMTGKRPSTLGIRDNGGGTLGDDELTLAEHLQAQGYLTVASVGAFVTTRTWGFGQGFRRYFDDIPENKRGDFWHGERAGGEVVDDLLGWKAGAPDDRPIFAWVHLYDAHFPFRPPSPWAEEQAGRPYDGEIAYLDHQVSRLVQGFEGDRPTLFVIAGDHGEGLGEHGELSHGLFTYNSTQHVPLIISGAGVEAAVITQPTSLVDLAPTVLDLLGLPPLANAEGAVSPGVPHPIYLETYQLGQRFGLAPHRALIDGGYKLIDLPRPELYRADDQDETDNLAAAHIDQVERLQALLTSLAIPAPTSRRLADPGVAMQLQALGYAEPSFQGDLGGELPDPKDHIGMLVKNQRSERLSAQGKFDQAEAVLRELIDDYPEVVEFQSRLAQILSRQGKPQQALKLLVELFDKHPDNIMLKFSLATQLARAKQPRKAARLLQEVAKEMPYAPRVRTQAVSALLEAPGAANEAFALGFEYLEEYPDDHHLAGLLGVELSRLGRFKQALPLLEQGALASRPERGVCFQLASAEAGRGNTLESRHLLERELEGHPRNLEAAHALLRLLGTMKDWQAQIDATSHLDVRKSRDVEFWYLRAQAQFNLQDYAAARLTLDKALAFAPEASVLMLLDANLIAKEGDIRRAKVRFEQAKAAKAREVLSGKGAKAKGR